MDQANHSRVTVECHDPSGVFPFVQDQLIKRLPLRNLKWKAASRPLRQIDALHVDFGPHGVATTSNVHGSPRPEYKQRSVTTPAGDFHPERRHQIPGLRQTPYVKVYLVRCDDKETYKTKVRKQIQTWLSANSPPTQSTTALNKHQYHDACDLLILHVVMPGTVAASEPRWSQHSLQDSDELAERSKRTPWPAKSGTTVLDKIRSDFSIHAKNDFDRVAQVRLQKLPNALPTPSTVPAYPETPQEQEQAWQDFMSKLKTSILHSFDLRVSQYEDDIAEKEAQRSLPGWNFCTFFTLKEGLARGFESVGLVEDSLAIYEELSVGLDAVARDDTTLLGDMTDLQRDMSELQANGDPDALQRVIHFSTNPLELDVPHYRHTIVSSTISVFDFKTYLFTREKALLYRLADFDSSPSPSAAPEISLIAEVCIKATAFITSNMRVLRHELLNKPGQEPELDYTDIADALCASWAFAALDQIQSETEVICMTAIEAAQTVKSERSNSAGGANPYPIRKSSIPGAGADGKSRGRAHEESGSHDTVTTLTDSSLIELVAARADIFLLQRRILESLALTRQWYAGLTAVEKANQQLIEPVISQREVSDLCLKTLTPPLATALTSETSFRATYETLSDLAIRHCLLAGRNSASEALLGDLGLLKSQMGDCSGAVQHFQRVLAKSGQQKLDAVQLELLKAHAACLKKLNRRDEFIRVSLKVLHFSEINRQESRLINEIVESSRHLTYDFPATYDDFFENRVIRPYIEHAPDRHGCFVRFSCQSFLKDDLVLDKVSLKLVDASDSGQELLLHSVDPVISRQGHFETILETNVSTFGQFIFDTLTVQVEKLLFVHRYLEKEKQTAFAFASASEHLAPSTKIKGPSLVCFPKNGALRAEVTIAPSIKIHRRRMINALIFGGDIDSDEIDIRLRPASAGLRLHIADLGISTGATSYDCVEDGSIRFKESRAGGHLQVEVPYTLEIPLSRITIKIEVKYRTHAGEFKFCSTTSLDASLALDVEVNDTFKHTSLYSRFRIKTNNGMPMWISKYTPLDGSKHFAVDPIPLVDEFCVSNDQPLSLCYRISRKPSEGDAEVTPLRLNINYRQLDEVLLTLLALRFASALAKSPYSHLENLLRHYLVLTTEALLTSKTLEDAVLSGFFVLPTFDNMGWSKLIRALSPELRDGLTSWLQQWHVGNPLIEDTHDPVIARRSLLVPMDITKIDILQTVQIVVLEPAGPHRASEPISTELKFNFSRNWAARSSTDPASFTYAIRDTSGIWLIAGQIRGAFTVEEGSEYRVKLVLIPRRAGMHLLPTVDIVPSAVVAEDSTQPKPTYRTDFVSALQKVTVIAQSQAVNGVCLVARRQAEGMSAPVAATVDQSY